ncbi:TPA: relaxase domain-containing protein [Escherichia coli]|nr:relaxase domain-containing protein [Escherichia coli]HCN1687939.1 relaxase domain-containing protein [Escherichia coli]HCN4141316.1 relaxase domain-containing protein [Escherichia coli]
MRWAGKTGFIENVYANQIAFGRLYREKLKEQVEALGYETEVVGKHGMWEMPGVPVEAFSGRSQTIREAVGEDASLKSRDVAALDTRKSKQHVDPEIKMVEWMQTLKETGFDSRSRYLRDMYRPGMVMEQWNPETRSHDRYVIDRVAGLVMTVLTVGLVSCAGKSLPRFWPGDFFPTFYACHLAVLGVLAL